MKYPNEFNQEEFNKKIEDREKEIILELLKEKGITMIGEPDRIMEFLTRILKQQRKTVASEYMNTTREKFQLMRTIDVYDLLCVCSFSYVEHLQKQRDEKEQKAKEKAQKEKPQAIIDAMIALHGEPCTFGGLLTSLSRTRGWNNANYKYFCELRQELTA